MEIRIECVAACCLVALFAYTCSRQQQQILNVEGRILVQCDSAVSTTDTITASCALEGLSRHDGYLGWFVDGVPIDAANSDTLRYSFPMAGNHIFVARFVDTTDGAAYEDSREVAAGIRGTVLLTRGCALALVDCATREYRIVATGPITGCRFSPDGERIVYWSNNAFHIVDVNGENDTIALLSDVMPIHMNWVDTFGIVWSRADETEPYVFSGQPFSGRIDTLYTSTQGGFISVSISQNGQHLAWSRPEPDWHVWTLDLVNRTERSFGVGCQGTVSNDGTLFTHNQSDHRHAFVRQFSNGSVTYTIRSPRTEEFQFHRFSSQSKYHVVYQTDYRSVYVTDIRTDVRQYVGDCVTGYPHDFSERTYLDEIPRPVLSMPEILPQSRRFSDSVIVSIVCDPTAVPIFYTTDGTVPTSSSQRYHRPFVIEQSCEVRAKCIDGSVESPLANAVYLAPRSDSKSILVTAPNGGEWFSPGDSMNIAWQSPDSKVANVSISVSFDQGTSWHLVTNNGSITRYSPSWGNYSWVVPETFDGVGTSSHYCLLRVSNYEQTLEDRSDAYFVIDKGE